MTATNSQPGGFQACVVRLFTLSLPFYASDAVVCVETEAERLAGYQSTGTVQEIAFVSMPHRADVKLVACHQCRDYGFSSGVSLS